MIGMGRLTCVSLLLVGVAGCADEKPAAEGDVVALGSTSQALTRHRGFGWGWPGRSHWWPKPSLTPLLECVEPGPHGTYIAHWGYDNSKDETRSLPVGLLNHFSWPWGQGQPQSFDPGEHHNVFTTRFFVRRGFGSSTWSLDGKFAVATRYSTPCTPPPQCEQHSDCADDLWCNGYETCEEGACVPGDLPCVDTLNFCDGVIICDEAVQYCVAENIPANGTVCTQTSDEAGVCENLQCVPEVECVTNSDCSDGLGCNGAEICDNNVCAPGTDPCVDTNDNVCDGGVGCTEEPVWQCIEQIPPGDGTACALPNGEEGFCLAELCLPPGACIDNSDCSDGLACNGFETCLDNECEPGVVPCVDTDTESCNGGIGCEEGPPWTCVGVPSPTPGTVCPLSNGEEGVCSNEQCIQCSTDANCNDGLFCTGVETCNAGLCEPGTSPCIDPDTNVCNGGVQCSENGCTASDSPAEGTDCALESGAIGVCAGQVCTLSGACIADVDCSDGLSCNGEEQCNNGACQAGTPPAGETCN